MLVSDELGDLITGIRSEIEEKMGTLAVPGVSIAIVDETGPVWTEVFGHTSRSKTVRVTPDTLFMIGSLSKAYTATAFLRAVQKGLVGLDDPLRKYYPEFRWNTRFGGDELDKITFRYLLAHRAGLQHNTMTSPPGETTFYSFEEFIRRAGEGWQKYPVGARFSYSNIGYELVAYALERISGMSFGDFMEAEVYAPLGMQNSLVDPAKVLKLKHCAKGHIGERETPFAQTLIPHPGAGAQYSSVNDMSKFLMMHFNKGFAGKTRFLDPALLGEMYRIPFAEEHQLFAIGNGIGVVRFRYGGALMLSFLGDGPGYVGIHQFYPELGIGWLMQMNQIDGAIPFMSGIARKIMPELAKSKLGKLPADLTVNSRIRLPSPIRLDPKVLKRLEGKYISRMLDITLELSEEGLTFSLRGKDIILSSHTETVFSSPDVPLVTFTKDSTGRPMTVKIVQSDGDITVLDYDSGPADGFGPNKPEWAEHSCIYKLDWRTFYFYSAPRIINGYLHLVTTMGNKEYQLREHRQGVFFTADGQNVVFKEDKLILPDSTWIKEDISVPKIQSLLRSEPDNTQVNKKSLKELEYLLRRIGREEEAKEIEALIHKHYPDTKES